MVNTFNKNLNCLYKWEKNVLYFLYLDILINKTNTTATINKPNENENVLEMSQDQTRQTNNDRTNISQRKNSDMSLISLGINGINSINQLQNTNKNVENQKKM